MTIPKSSNFSPYPTHYTPYVEPSVLEDGSKIEGDLSHGTGIGSRTFEDGTIWKGTLVSWSLEGPGEKILPDGTIHQGIFHNSVLHGKGTITSPSGQLLENGIFEKGILAYKKV